MFGVEIHLYLHMSLGYVTIIKIVSSFTCCFDMDEITKQDFEFEQDLQNTSYKNL